jgi:hypothetical protein
MRKFLILVFLIALPIMANAGTFSLGGGANSNNIIATSNEGQSYFVAWEGKGAWHARIQAGEIRSGNQPQTFNTKYVSVSLIHTLGAGFVGVGGAKVSRSTWQISTPYDFILTAGYHITTHLAIMLQHISNADTGGTNRGANLLEMQISF